MKKFFIIVIVSIGIFIGFHSTSFSWGFYAHKKVNRLAVFTLPPSIFSFYKANIEFITEHAVDPDKRRYGVDGEAPRHYIDIDHYIDIKKEVKDNPFDVVPRKWEDAVAKFTEDTLQAYGIVPWHLEVMMYRLTKAFKDENIDRILRYSSDLGHYVGDAHVPLHTTENYNGQLTGQKGIHGFWESRLPELFSEDYDFFVGKARYIEDIRGYIWETIEQSHLAMDSVLSFERKLNDEFPKDRKYNYETRGSSTVKQYSREYSAEFHVMLDGMVERRMRRAIITVGCFWYTAWVNAGQPDLDNISSKEISEEMLKELEAAEKKYQQRGKIIGREHGH